MTGRARKLLFITALFFALSWPLADAYAYQPGKPHDLSLNNPKGHCLNCHDPHQPNLGAGFPHTLKRANEIAVCYQCHAGSLNSYSSIDLTLSSITSVLAPYDIRSEFGQPNIHFPKYGMDGEVNKCSECHNPHGVFNSNSTARLPKLLSASQDAVTGTEEFCFVCHNSDQNPPHRPFSNITVRNQFKFSRTVFQQMAHSAFQRSTTMNEPMPDSAHTYDDNPYGKGKDISCLTCHRPHGSANAYMLKAPNDQTFCLSCHKGGVVNGYVVNSLSSFTGTGHGKASMGTYKRICQDCHFPHGTGQKNALYTTLTDPHTGRVNHDNIARSGVNSVCFACHGSRSVSGYYPRTSFYRASIHKTSGNALNPGSTNGQAPGDCDNCHDPHGRGYPKMTADKDDQTLCFDCHNATTPNTASGRDVKAAFSMASHHDLTKVACKNCHNVHAVTQSTVMMNPYSPMSTVNDNKTFCMKCHNGTMPAGVTGAPNIAQEWAGGHGRNNILTCSDCHASHGSPNAKTINYLTVRYGGYSATFGSKTGLSFNKRKFCESCHNHRGTTGYKGASTIEAGTGRPDAHGQNDTTPCSNCHTKKHNPLLTNYTGSNAYYTSYCLNCHTQGTGAAYETVDADFNYPNRAVNGGMENNLSGWGIATGLTAASDMNTFHSGAASAKLTTTTTTGDHYLQASSNIAVLPSRSYTYSGWVYVQTALSGGSTALRVVEWNQSGGYLTEHVNPATSRQQPTNGWVYVSDTWTTNSQTAQLSIRINNLGIGTAWWDDLSLVPGGAVPQNGSTHAITYNPPATNDCSVCHGNHSNLTPVNDVKDPNPGYMAGASLNSTQYNAFCLKCHGTSPVTIGGQTPPNIIDTYTAAGHGMRSLTRNVLCTECHEHHGSVNKKLVKTVISGAAVSANYSGINIATCAACHKALDRNLPYWSGYSVYSGSVHAYGNLTTGNLARDGRHGAGACDNCHNPHGVRSDGSLMPFMAYKKQENLCYRCHASGFDNFSSSGDYNNKWDHFGTVLGIAKQVDTSNGNRLAGLHIGQSGGQSIAQNVAVWDGLVSSNAYQDNDAAVTVRLKVPNYIYKTGQLTAGLRLEDAITASNNSPTKSNYIGVFYNMSTSTAWRCGYNSQGTGGGTVAGSATSYTTLKIVRRKAFGTFSSYVGTQPVLGGRFTTSGYFKVRLYAYASGNKNAVPEALEAWFDNFSVQYTSGGSAHNTSSGDDVQARFQMTTHHKISDADQVDGSKVECTDCHDPHTITEKKMGYENTSSASGKGVVAVAADQDFCLKCHGGTPPAGVRFPAIDSIVWDKSLYDSSAHGNTKKRYKTLQSGQTQLNYSTLGPVGVIACKVCHNPHGSNQAHMQRESWDINRDGIPDDINGDGILDSSTQVGYIGYSTSQSGSIVYPKKVILVSRKAGIPSRAAFARISTTIAVQANGAIDVELCLNCHDGKPAPDVRSDFEKPSHHPVEYSQQVALGGAKIECYNCHDQHRAQARNDAAGEYPTTNPAGNREPMAGDAAFCLKCHDTSGGATPPGVYGISFGNVQLKNIKLSYNPNNYTDGSGYDIITSSRQGHFVYSSGKAIMCRVCHNQHGSNYGRMLRDDTEPGKPGYDPTQPIQNMRPVVLDQSDPYSGGDSTAMSTTAERCLSCHSGKTTYNGGLIPLPPPPDSSYRGFTSLPEVGKHPDISDGMIVGSGLTSANGHLYSNSFAVSTSTGSVKDSCTTCHDSHNPYITTVGDELTDCYRCHNANTSLPDVQTEFNANPLNATHSASYHPIKYDPTKSGPSGVECLKCHDQTKHMQGRVRLRKNPSQFINYTSDKMVWVSQPTSGGNITDSTQKFTNNSTISRFCIECHSSSSTVSSGFSGKDASGVNGTHNPKTMPFNIMSGAHFRNANLVCTSCHEYHGSVSTTLKKNSFTTNYEPTPAAQAQPIDDLTFCYSCHTNKQKSKDGVDIKFQFMSTVTHHQVGTAEQAANGSKVACANCHNPHLVTRGRSVTYANTTTLSTAWDSSFCISCHNGTGAPGVKFPGYTTGGSGPEWDPVTGKWNKWNKQAFTSSPHSAPGGVACRSCHDPHGSKNYALLLPNISSALGSAKNVSVGFGKHSTIRGKRTEEMGVNGVCAACHKNAMGIYSGMTVYPGYKSYTGLTFGRKTGVDKNCTYCHNPHGTSQTRFGNDTSALARMMRANKPLYMNMTSKNFGSVYNFRPRGFANSSTGAPYYVFCSSNGCHASERAQVDTFNMDLPPDNYSHDVTKSSHHPIKEGIIGCNSCHMEHGTSTAASNYLAPDLRAPYVRQGNWYKLYHSGKGLAGGGNGAEGGSGGDGTDFFYTHSPNPITPPDNASDLCYMCHQKTDIIGNYTTGMAGTNTKFLGHEAVKGGAMMTHQISPVPIPANGEYHNFSCSVCHFPHSSYKGKLLQAGCMSQADSPPYPYSPLAVSGSSGSSQMWGCHAYRNWSDYGYNTGWRNLTTAAKTDFDRPHKNVTDLHLTVDSTQTDRNMSVYLTWTAATDDGTGSRAHHYNVYRSPQYITQDSKPYAVRVAKGVTGAGSVITFTDTNARATQLNARYYYAVVACDAQNNESFISNCAGPAVLGPDTVPPNPVTPQLMQADGTYNVKVTWTDPGDNINVASYKVYRQAGVSGITNLSQATLLSTVADTFLSWDGSGTGDPTYSYTDTTTLTQGQQYAYAVVALDAAGNASQPTAASVIIQNPAPDRVTTLTAAPANRTMNAQLGWSAPASVGGITSYNVYRKAGSALTQSDLGGVGSANYVGSTNGTTTTYTDTLPLTAVNYYYAVTAVNVNATSAYAESLIGNCAGPVNIPLPPTGMTGFYNFTTSTFRKGPSVTWNAPAYTTGLSGYNVYRRLNGGAWAFCNTAASTSMTLSFEGLQPGSYDICASAVYSTYEGVSNYEGPLSGTATFNVTDTAAPSSFTVTGSLTPDHLHAVLSWNAPSDNNYTGYSPVGVDHYEITASYDQGTTWGPISNSLLLNPSFESQFDVSYPDYDCVCDCNLCWSWGGFNAWSGYNSVPSYNLNSTTDALFGPTAAVIYNPYTPALSYIYSAGPAVSSVAGQTYSMSFWAKASKATTFAYSIQANGANNEQVGAVSNRAIGTTWQRFSTSGTFSSSASATSARVNIYASADSTASIKIDGVRLATGADALVGDLKDVASCFQPAGYNVPGTALTFNDPSILAGGGYAMYRVQAADSQANYSPTASVTVDAGPSAITNLSVARSYATSANVLTFGPSTSLVGLGSYKIYAVQQSPPLTSAQLVPQNLIGTNTTNLGASQTFVHDSHNAVLPAVIGQTYSYAVIPEDVSGVDSVNFNSVTFTVVDGDAPAAVTDLAASSTDGVSATLTWSMPSDPNGDLATQYQVYRLAAVGSCPGAAITDSNLNTATLLYTGAYGSNQPGATLSYTAAGLDGSTPHYAVRSSDATGNWSLVSNSPSVVARPTAVTVSAASSSTTNANVLSWTASTSCAGIVSYNIYAVQQSTALTCAQMTSQNLISTVTGTTFTHDSNNPVLPAVVGRIYAYGVVANDANGRNSACSNSPVLTVVDRVPPAQVTDLAASTSSAAPSVTLAWSMPADPDAGGTTQYKIYRLPTVCTGTPVPVTGSNYSTAKLVYTGSYGSSQPGAQISYTDTTMCDGSGAYYAVMSGDAAGNWSPVSNSPYVATRPTAIANLSVASSSTKSANVLSWSVSTSLAGIAGYNIYAVQQSTALNASQLISQNLIGSNIATTTFTHDANNSVLPALAGKIYTYAVIAVGSNGLNSAISNSPVFTVLDKDGPDKIGSTANNALTLTSPVGSSTVVLTWPTPHDNVGATKYVVYHLPTSSVGTPAPVTDANYATAFRVYSGTYQSSVSGTTNTYTDTTWYDGLGVYYAIRSRDAAGNWSPVSNSPYIVIGHDGTAPSQPVITNATAAASPEVDVYWNVSTDPDDQVSGYALYRADASVAPFSTDGCITPNNVGQATLVSDTIAGYWPGQPVYADTGGTPGHTYYYALKAFDTNDNWSSPSYPSATVTVTENASVTTPPSAVTLTVAGDPYVSYPDIDLTWTPAADNGPGQAGTIDHYNVYRSTTSFSSTTGRTPIAQVAGVSTYYIDSTGYAGTTYYYGVTAVDASSSHLVSALSNVGSATVGAQPCTDSGANGPGNVPTAPGSLAASTGVYPYINLGWTASTDMDDCRNTQPLNYYKLYRVSYPNVIVNSQASADATHIWKNDPAVLTFMVAYNVASYTDRGSGGAQYNYAIEAFDMAGNSSGISNVATGQVADAPCTTTNPPSAPGSFNAAIGPAPDIDLTWSAATVGGCAGSNAVDHYNLYRDTKAITSTIGIAPRRISGTNTSFVDSTGAPNTQYWYVLTAVDSLGNESAMSSVITKTTAADMMAPSFVNDLKATPMMVAGMVQLAWCRPTDNIGVDHFDIYRVAKSTILTDQDIVPANRIATSYNAGICLSYNDYDTANAGTGVTGTTYSYAVIAVDKAGNRSTISSGKLAGDAIAVMP